MMHVVIMFMCDSVIRDYLTLWVLQQGAGVSYYDRHETWVEMEMKWKSRYARSHCARCDPNFHNSPLCMRGKYQQILRYWTIDHSVILYEIGKMIHSTIYYGADLTILIIRLPLIKFRARTKCVCVANG